MPRTLKPTRFGNPILRKKAKLLSTTEIISVKIQNLIKDMRHTLVTQKYGVGLAAPQVGKNLAFSVIGIKPTPTRPNEQNFESIIINPKIIKTYGPPVSMWEGCISGGSGDDTLYAQVPRYKKIKLRWQDEKAQMHEEILEGMPAHVAQHETDHLNGILFVDRVKNTKTFMMADEYRKRIVKIEK